MKNADDSRGPATTTPWPIGKVVGNLYQIRGVLGRGGMGVVYQAYDQGTHRLVAVKVPLTWEGYDDAGRRRVVRFVDSPRAKAALVQEVRAWIGLAHPNVVNAFDVLDDSSTDYLPAILMEYCDGGSLWHRVYRGGGLTVAEGLEVALQVCWAMEYVHERGLVHRDLKPANVLLTQDGNGGVGKALVTDLGLALALGWHGGEGEAERLEGGAVALGVTVSKLGGTPSHMAPEQWTEGGRVGPPSDLYAFGVMLYEIFCAKLPFAGDSLASWAHCHCAGSAPEPQALNRAVPEALAELMKGCLAKEERQRPGGFGEMGGTLERIRRGLPGADAGMTRQKPGPKEVTERNRRQQARAKLSLGAGTFRRGDLEAAELEFKEAGAIYLELDDRAGLSACLGNQGLILQAWGRLEEAMALHKQQESISRELGDRTRLSRSLGHQGLILQAWGRLEEAMALYKQQESICRELGDRAGLASCLGNQGLFLRECGG